MAKWLWKDDSGWIEYDKKIAKKLEKAFRDKETECAVDKERYVDFSAMLQRRFDDKMKRRNVKREKVEPFKKEVFFILGKLGGKKDEEIKDDIELAGGLVAPTLNKKVFF